MSKQGPLLVTATALFAASVLTQARPGQLSETFTNWIAHPAIAYRTTPATDPVAILSQQLQDGRLRLQTESPAGYLRSVLKALDVPIESQMAVFVPDSVQARRITRSNPRTLFFNDSVVVGWVRGGFIELAAEDPQRGTIFYSLEQTLIGTPRITRRNDCLTCHYSYSTAGVPGMLVRSVGQFAVDHRLPLEQRWGGWYVTGNHGAIQHMGNADLSLLLRPQRPTNTSNWPTLEGKVDWQGYLTPYSDIVALLVFEHQMHAMNLLTRIGWEARVAEYERQHSGARTQDTDARSGGTPISLDEAARELVDYFLFVDEAPLSSPIRGSSGFSESFVARGPYDTKGRSLRQLDLQHRLMRYPCSYTIYGTVFTELPSSAREAIYRRMWRVLSGEEKAAKYKRLSFDDRQAIIEILRDTKKDLPGYFRTITPAPSTR